MKTRTKYPVRIQFLTTEEQKMQLEQIAEQMLIDSSTAMRMILAEFLLQKKTILSSINTISPPDSE